MEGKVNYHTIKAHLKEQRAPRGFPGRSVFQQDGRLDIQPSILPLFHSYTSAAFARSTSAVKAAGSAMAISDSALRFMVMSAFFSPFMNRL